MFLLVLSGCKKPEPAVQSNGLGFGSCPDCEYARAMEGHYVGPAGGEISIGVDSIVLDVTEVFIHNDPFQDSLHAYVQINRTYYQNGNIVQSPIFGYTVIPECDTTEIEVPGSYNWSDYNSDPTVINTMDFVADTIKRYFRLIGNYGSPVFLDYTGVKQ